MSLIVDLLSYSFQIAIMSRDIAWSPQQEIASGYNGTGGNRRANLVLWGIRISFREPCGKTSEIFLLLLSKTWRSQAGSDGDT